MLFASHNLLGLSTIACWALCAAGLAVCVASAARQITYVTLADGRRAERKIPLLLRLLLPFVPNLAPLAGRAAFASSRAAADKMILAAGLEGLLTGTEFVALKLLVPLVAGSAWVAFALALGALVPDSFFSENRLVLALLGVAYFYAYPLLWLRGLVKRRHLAILRALPFVLDLLTLSVEAGMDFMSALQRNCERGKLDPLNEELIRTTREIQVGTPRRTALKNLATRTGQSDLRSVTHALVQADELGVSIGSILRIQSDQLRARRFDRAEKLANEAPVKMLGPLLVFIFPAVFVILLGPLIRQAAGSVF